MTCCYGGEGKVGVPSSFMVAKREGMIMCNSFCLRKEKRRIMLIHCYIHKDNIVTYLGTLSYSLLLLPLLKSCSHVSPFTLIVFLSIAYGKKI